MSRLVVALTHDNDNRAHAEYPEADSVTIDGGALTVWKTIITPGYGRTGKRALEMFGPGFWKNAVWKD